MPACADLVAAQQVKSSRARPAHLEIRTALRSMVTNHATLCATSVSLPHEAASSGAPVVVLRACANWQLQPSHIPSHCIGKGRTGGEELISSAQTYGRCLESSSTSSVYYGSILIDFKLLSLTVFTLR